MKRYVTLDDFVFKMMQECSNMKYIYEDHLNGCISAVEAQYHIKCIASRDEIIREFKSMFQRLSC